MTELFRDEIGNQWTVDEVAPGGVGSISDTGMVGNVPNSNSTTLLFRHIPEGTMRIASDAPVTCRSDEAVVAHALAESVTLDTLES